MLFCYSFDSDVVGASNAGWHSVWIPPINGDDVPTGIDPDLIFSMCGDLFAVLDIFGLDPHFRLIPTTRVNDERGELLYIRAKLHIFLETCSYLICFGSFRQLHG